MILKDTKLKSNLKAIVKSELNLKDIIVFGSSVRGKEKPNDLDILVLFKNSIDKELEYKIRKIFEIDYKNIAIISKTEETLLDESFDAREGILFEGISLLSGKRIAGKYGFVGFGMFKYNFCGWNNLKKTKFYHALNGRNSKGVIDRLSCIRLSDSLILTPLENIDKFKEFLDNWHLNYVYIPMLIPSRLGRKIILE